MLTHLYFFLLLKKKMYLFIWKAEEKEILYPWTTLQYPQQLGLNRLKLGSHRVVSACCLPGCALAGSWMGTAVARPRTRHSGTFYPVYHNASSVGFIFLSCLSFGCVNFVALAFQFIKRNLCILEPAYLLIHILNNFQALTYPSLCWLLLAQGLNMG